MVKHHGLNQLTGMSAHCRMGHETTRNDRFGRMFPHLAAAYVPANVLKAIGAPGGPMDGGAKKARTKSVPVGHVFFGQFIDHDITLDVSSSFGRVNRPNETPNVRTPTLDLDCVYGGGPEANPFMYVQDGAFEGVKLLTGADMLPTGDPAKDALQAQDLLRAPNDRAIIGDPRNDENRIVSQLQLAMIRFHNAMADAAKAADPGLTGAALLEEARRLTTWHYQWGVVNDFLVAMCGAGPIADILSNGRRFYCPVEPQIPIEFAVAAYRFGHSMAPMKIQVQSGGPSFTLFGPELGQGFKPLGGLDAVVDWRELMFEPDRKGVQTADKLDVKLAGTLLSLPFVGAGDEASLATRNLLRGNSFLLPGGDRVAAAMDRPEEEIRCVMDKVEKVSGGAITEGAPLWLYILAEAEEIGRLDAKGRGEKGEGLGPVGGRIVAEVIIGLLELDEESWLGANRNWTPAPAYDSIGKILVSQNAPLF